MAEIIRKGDERLPADADALLGTIFPTAERFVLVGFHVHNDHGQIIFVPVWKDRKNCIKEARSKY